MKNQDKYKTADERIKAFNEWCDERLCSECTFGHSKGLDDCALRWLELETEHESPLTCPFCGWECRVIKNKNEVYVVGCSACCYKSQDFISENDAIAAHNRVARAVMEAKKNEVSNG